MGSRLAFLRASSPEMISPLYLAFHFPVATSAMQARGPRSPLAPRDPLHGIQGRIPLL